jgi:hypothetical protein
MSMQMHLNGVRVESSEFYSGSNYTIVSAPAPDAFSHPSRFKVQSPNVIGGQGQFIDLVLNVSGIVRTKNFQDKNTGQMKTFNEANVYFEVVTSKPSMPASVSKSS